MILDELLEERHLFIAHEAAHTYAQSKFAQAWHSLDGQHEVVRYVITAQACINTAKVVHSLRERGEL